MPKHCSIDGCEEIHYAKGLCKPHYAQQPHQAEKRRAYYADPRVRSRKRENDKQRWQDPARRAYKEAWDRAYQDARREWGAWWEDQRRRQDKADLKADTARQARRQRRIKRATKPLPPPRRWVAGQCLACGKGWVDYQARQPSGYCRHCQIKRWAADSRHKRRAWKAQSTIIDVISPEVVFKRDGYRCQICKRKTRGAHPHPRSPTIDHIVPLAAGGDHSYLNVQCACFECNTIKGIRSANDQLRLIA